MFLSIRSMSGTCPLSFFSVNPSGEDATSARRTWSAAPMIIPRWIALLPSAPRVLSSEVSKSPAEVESSDTSAAEGKDKTCCSAMLMRRPKGVSPFLFLALTEPGEESTMPSITSKEAPWRMAKWRAVSPSRSAIMVPRGMASMSRRTISVEIPASIPYRKHRATLLGLGDDSRRALTISVDALSSMVIRRGVLPSLPGISTA